MLSNKPKEEKKTSFVRRDRLIEIEKEAQQLWESTKAHEREIDTNRPKYFVTFPYPYMNGRLHLGHAYSLSKAEFQARYKTLKGYNSLFPFGFHCTGMPISAAAIKLKEEYDKFSVEELEARHQRRVAKDEVELKRPTGQYEILRQCGVEPDHVASFRDAVYWLHYFPQEAVTDLKRFGVGVDFRRSFITTDVNPYYDSFIQWQFNTIKKGDFIKFGKRPSIYSEKDKQMCADHDRAEGEGVLPQEYTLIKLQVVDDKLADIVKTDKRVYLVAATLRPETMYGQTNCYVLPEGKYGIYEMANGELWVCSAKSARNMSFQNLTSEWAKVQQVAEVQGTKLIGLKVTAPLASYEFVYVWPMLDISMDKGTGIVTSVPSDSPDDFAVLTDLKAKQPLREKFGLTDEMVLPFEPISIIHVPEYSDMSAVDAYKTYKVKSMNDKEQLRKAKEECYLKGFYSGIMKVGEFKDTPVQVAKQQVRNFMIENNQAAAYFEPESKCISRSGDECVVALCDQWYINYGAEGKEQLKKHVTSSNFNAFNDTVRTSFVNALDWLSQWGCSRSFGLGTKLPWDPQYLIESLSDSTIYMAYYTICHMLHSDIEGKNVGELGIKAQDLKHEDWDYIFLKAPYTQGAIEESKLKQLRESFEYWYPLDLRCSGKDLIKNHLTMSLYNHFFVWGEEKVPRGVFCNGWVLVNKEKMSKMKGNFFTLAEMCDKFSADATRLGLANAGDTLEDANVELEEAEKAILKLSNIETWLKETAKSIDTFREDTPAEVEFYDKVFENEVNEVLLHADKAYEGMVMREVIKQIFFNLNHIKEDYKLNCGSLGLNKQLTKNFIEAQLIALYPITPHFCEIMWKTYYLPMLSEEERASKPQLVSQARFPEITLDKIDRSVVAQSNFLKKLGTNLRSTYEKFRLKKKDAVIKKIYFVTSEGFKEWQVSVMEYLRGLSDAERADWKKNLMSVVTDKAIVKKSMEFASYKVKESETGDSEAFSSNSYFNEKQLILAHINFICKEVINVDQLEVLSESEAEKSDVKSVKQVATNVLPGNPIIVIDF